MQIARPSREYLCSQRDGYGDNKVRRQYEVLSTRVPLRLTEDRMLREFRQLAVGYGHVHRRQL